MKYLFTAVLLAGTVAGFGAADAAGGCGPGWYRGPYGGSIHIVALSALTGGCSSEVSWVLATLTRGCSRKVSWALNVLTPGCSRKASWVLAAAFDPAALAGATDAAVRSEIDVVHEELEKPRSRGFFFRRLRAAPSLPIASMPVPATPTPMAVAPAPVTVAPAPVTVVPAPVPTAPAIVVPAAPAPMVTVAVPMADLFGLELPHLCL
jgi:hypothetical protein